MAGLLDGKAVIVTGSGRGVGRAIALAASAEGARVVINDIGAAPGGEAEAGVSPAQEAVNEIRAAGGEAVANTDTVSTWAGAQRIVQTAMDHFGRIDGIVNNAGILRDMMFHKLEPEDFDAVIDVNLKGPFYMCRAAAPHLKAQASGSFVHMTSTSALIGNLGQANYMAAKMGLLGLSKSIAMDMQGFNVTSNCIAPFAWTRMVSTIPDVTPEQKARVEGLRRNLPEKIAPLTIALLSDEGRARVNGQVFGVRNNEIFFFSHNRPTHITQNGEGWTPDTILERAIPMLEPHFYPLLKSGEYFSWAPC
jgi:NAD(P)-dependent dehydrogenase (short-subunit alcohol dehydrogenase family)